MSRAERVAASSSVSEALDIWAESFMDESPGYEFEFLDLARAIQKRWPSDSRERPGYWYSRDRDIWMPIPKKTE